MFSSRPQRIIAVYPKRSHHAGGQHHLSRNRIHIPLVHFCCDILSPITVAAGEAQRAQAGSDQPSRETVLPSSCVPRAISSCEGEDLFITIQTGT